MTGALLLGACHHTETHTDACAESRPQELRAGSDRVSLAEENRNGLPQEPLFALLGPELALEASSKSPSPENPKRRWGAVQSSSPHSVTPGGLGILDASDDSYWVGGECPAGAG